MPDNPDFSRAQSQSAALRNIAAEKLATRRLLRRMSSRHLGQLVARVQPQAHAHERWAMLLVALVADELSTRELGL